MILDDIRPRDAQLSLIEWTDGPAHGSQDAGEVEDLLQSMGFFFSTTSAVEPDPDQPEQSWTRSEETIVYRARVAHAPDAMQWIDPYTAAVLSTCGARHLRAVADARLAVYELCRNVIEHGHPVVTDPTLRLTFTLAADRIEICIEDDCQPFNPLTHFEAQILNRVSAKEKRGYGLTLVGRSIEEFTYTALPSGNQLTLKKRIHP